MQSRRSTSAHVGDPSKNETSADTVSLVPLATRNNRSRTKNRIAACACWCMSAQMAVWLPTPMESNIPRTTTCARGTEVDAAAEDEENDDEVEDEENDDDDEVEEEEENDDDDDDEVEEEEEEEEEEPTGKHNTRSQPSI